MNGKHKLLSKVPAITLGFWIVKILATALGGTGGDSVTMKWLGETAPSAGLSGVSGYLVETAIFGLLLLALVWAQIEARRFHRWLYWATIVASTTVGTMLADFAHRSLGIGFPGSSLVFCASFLASLFFWYRTIGSISVNTVAEPKVEVFYWVTITFSQTLGTALGDWIASTGLGYSGGALVFGLGLALLAALYFWPKLSRVALFWAAFIFTRPIGETVGDFLYRPISEGGLQFGRPLASSILSVMIIGMVLILPQRSGRENRADPNG